MLFSDCPMLFVIFNYRNIELHLVLQLFAACINNISVRCWQFVQASVTTSAALKWDPCFQHFKLGKSMYTAKYTNFLPEFTLGK